MVNHWQLPTDASASVHGTFAYIQPLVTVLDKGTHT